MKVYMAEKLMSYIVASCDWPSRTTADLTDVNVYLHNCMKVYLVEKIQLERVGKYKPGQNHRCTCLSPDAGFYALYK